MQNIDIINKLTEQQIHEPSNFQVTEDLFEMARIYEKENKAKSHEINKIIRQATGLQIKNEDISFDTTERFYKLHKKSLLFDAHDELDAYMQYLEFDREPEKRFYIPRRKIIKPIIDSLQQIEDDELDLLIISQPPGTGKSTCGLIFLSWICGKYPNMPNLVSAHGDKLTRSFYDGVLSIITDPEYLWADVFPTIKIVNTNAKDESLDLDTKKRFSTLTCRSIDGALTGATRCEKILYADDLVSGHEEAESLDRMDSLWSKYTSDLKSRKKQGCKEIHVATRWSLHDVIGRLERQYGENSRCKILNLPATDDDGNSNFDYDYGVGFDTKYFADMKASLDDASYRALFMGEPIEREGLLFSESEMKFYNGVLPDGDPDRIVAVVDVAWGGGDTLSMPICYVYGDDAYIVDWIFNKGDKTITRPIVCAKLRQHMPHQVRLEANNGGDEYAKIVNDQLEKEGIFINISHRKAPSNLSKVSRIIQKSPEIKRFIYLDKEHTKTTDKAEYRKALKELYDFNQNGKNRHDDAPDSLGMLADFLNKGISYYNIVRRPF